MNELSDSLSTTTQIELGGKTYTISKMTVGIMADFQSTLAARDLKRGLDALKEAGCTSAERAEFIWQSHKRPSLYDTMELMQTAEGLILLVTMLLKEGGNPEVTEEMVGKLLRPDNMAEAIGFTSTLLDNGDAEVPGDEGNAQTVTEGAGTPSSQDSVKAGE